MPSFRNPPVRQMVDAQFPGDVIDFLVQLSAQFALIGEQYLVFPNGSRAIQTSAAKVLEESAATSTELGYLSGVTSALQTQLDGKVPKTTIAALVDNSGGTADGTIAAIPDPADTPATADALRDDLVTNVLPLIRNAIADLAAKLEAVRAAVQP